MQHTDYRPFITTIIKETRRLNNGIADTASHDAHVEAGGKPQTLFAGYILPVQHKAGVTTNRTHGRVRDRKQDHSMRSSQVGEIPRRREENALENLQHLLDQRLYKYG